MTTTELLAAPSVAKDAAALLERLERLRARHWQDLNNEGCYLLTLVRRAWEREHRATNRHLCAPEDCLCEQYANAAEDFAFGHWFR